MRFSVLLLVFWATAAWSADAFYEGSWKVAAAAVAPWWSDPSHQPSSAEMKTLLGQIIEFKKKEILGPQEAACRGPRYRLKYYPADMLFQGMFGEMATRPGQPKPFQTAASIGFNGTKWKTLETGCGYALDFHFLDDRTAMFALDNYIYTLRKQ